MSSIVLENRDIQNTLGSRGVNVLYPTSIKLDPNRDSFMQVDQILITTNILNVYTDLGFDNTVIRITTNGGTSWDILTLLPGSYSVSYIESAIRDRSIALGYWTSPLAVGFTLKYNLATKLCYVNIDSTLLVGGQFGIDFGSSDMWQLLGFGTPKSFVTDGLHSADLNPKIDIQTLGGFIDVSTNITIANKRSNSSPTNTIASVPTIAAAGQNYIVYPLEGFKAPLLEIGVGQITRFSVSYLNPTTGRPIIFGSDGCTTMVKIMQRGDRKNR